MTNENKNFNTPILLLIFRRPDKTLKLWTEIKKLNPKTLYIAADGPRENNEQEKIKCIQAREVIINDIDWDCDIHFLFQENNLGCGIAVKTALEWFFNEVTEGIILEDDCLPHPDFFVFCEELLERYRDNEKIFMISGNSVSQKYTSKLNSDYFFTYTPSAWGWATWKRSFEKYDFNLKELEKFKKEKIIEKIYTERQSQNFWLNFFKEVKEKNINTWDYQLAFTSFKYQGLCLRPKYNLITNLGTTFFSSGNNKHIANQEGLKVKTHPKYIQADVLADRIIMQTLLSPIYKIKILLKKIGLFNFLKENLKKYENRYFSGNIH